MLVFDVGLGQKSTPRKMDVCLVNQGSTQMDMQLVYLAHSDTLPQAQDPQSVFDADVECNQTLHKLIVNTVFRERSRETMESVSLVL